MHRTAVVVLSMSAVATVLAAAPDALVFEAESAVRIAGVFEFVRDAAMSDELGLQVREGMGTDFDETQAGQLRRARRQAAFDADGGTATYRFHVPEAGRYWAWARAFWLWECSNSIWIGPDADSAIILTDRIHGRWHWVRAERPVPMETGTSTFTIANREDGIRVDQFCLTRNRGFRPSGTLQSNVLVPRAETEPPLQLVPIMETPVVFPNADTIVTLWVRNPAGHPHEVSVDIAADDTLTVVGDPADTVTLAARSGLLDIPLKVRSRPKGRPLLRSGIRFAAADETGETVHARCSLVHALPWRAAGPFPSHGRRAVPSPQWHAAQPNPAPDARTLAGLSWRPVGAPSLLTGSGRVDLRRLFGRANTACWAYLKADVDWPADDTLAVELRSDDQGILWVNGQFVAAHRIVGPGERYHTACRLPLRRGPNTLLLAVNQLDAFWEASILPDSTD